MILTLPLRDLTLYISRQLDALFPDRQAPPVELQPFVARALERMEYCLRHVRVKYFWSDGQVRFDHLHTDQYAMFLYLIANEIYRREGSARLADRVYGLNKALHAVDVFYEVALPDIFAFQHPVGTVLGRATYGNYLYVYQNCCVGVSLEGVQPMLGEGVVMFGGSNIIGRCVVGSNCWLSVGTSVIDTDLPCDSMIFGHSPNLTIRPTQRSVRELFTLV